ncbi:DUF1835 domain-containing protein [Pseudogemmobacter humi]|uniref:DUF1835 domain-containing protein n=1 Tax=Pseudogemmobacter humi TaxID=2483812 RepID=A0A3P5XLI3_9RHOB|nr:DUF1835 domain-containing protein [Pseudogemmobacter humi]VDC31617.1 hypothetical protein XINFAN_02998 [Pseudogemmobacter humi]
MGRRLVVTPDPHSRRAIRRILGKGGGVRVCGFAEDLTIGPLPQTRDSRELRRARLRYWRQMIPDAAARPLWPPLSGAERVEIWTGGAAREQLFLIGLVDAALSQGVAPDRIAIRQFPAPSPRDALALMNLEALRSLRPDPLPCSPEIAGALRHLWRTVTAPDPGLLAAACRQGASVPGLPWLDRGLQAILEAYPDLASGLDLADRLLLQEVAAGRSEAARIVGHVMGAGLARGRLFADLPLFHRLRQMADPRLPAPALTLREDPGPVQGGEYHLTAAGADYLAGRRNAVGANGIDRWAGGVHLNSRSGGVWFRSGDDLIRRLTPP